MIGFRLLGVLLIACGALVAVLCAPCTLMGVQSLLQSGDDRTHMAPLLIAIWGVPMLFGLITVGVGVFLLFSPRPRSEPPP